MSDLENGLLRAYRPALDRIAELMGRVQLSDLTVLELMALLHLMESAEHRLHPRARLFCVPEGPK